MAKESPFRTVVDEHLELAELTVAYFKVSGYTVDIEPTDLSYPNTPTLKGRRGNAVTFVEVSGNVNKGKLLEWCKFAGAQSTDTKVAVVVPDFSAVDAPSITFLNAQRIGLFHLDGGRIRRALAPHDLTMKVELPDLAGRSQVLQQCLGPVFEKFEHADWKDAFTDACFELEDAARTHLKDGVKRKRITVLNKKGHQLNLTNKQISKLTQGQLAVHFSNIQAPNAEDIAIGKALSQLNRDRVGQIHHKKKKVTDNRLRKNVGKQMWLIAGVLEKVLKK